MARRKIAARGAKLRVSVVSAAATTATLAAMSVVAGVKRERLATRPAPHPRARRRRSLCHSGGRPPLQREVIHARHERAGLLRFRVYQNDGAAESLIALMHCKSIYGKQLPKMPKEYIVRLVLDRSHKSLACSSRGRWSAA